MKLTSIPGSLGVCKSVGIAAVLIASLSGCQTTSSGFSGGLAGSTTASGAETTARSARAHPGLTAYNKCRAARGHLDRNNINPNLPITNDICDVLYPIASDDLIPRSSAIQRAFGHQQAITTAGAIVAQGRFITGDIDSNVIIWDAAARRPAMQFRLADENRTILAAEMSPSGNYAAAILNVPGRIGYHFPNRLAIIDVRAKAVVHVVTFAGEGFGVQFSADDRFLLLGSRTFPGAAIWSVEVQSGKPVHGTHIASRPRTDIDTLSAAELGDLKLLPSDTAGEYLLVGKGSDDGSVSGRAVIRMASTGMLEFGRVSTFQAPAAASNWATFAKVTDGTNSLLACSNSRNCYALRGTGSLGGTRVSFPGADLGNLTFQRFSPSGKSVAVVEQNGRRVGIYSWPDLRRTDEVTDVDLGRLLWVFPALVWIDGETVAVASGVGMKFFRVKT